MVPDEGTTTTRPKKTQEEILLGAFLKASGYREKDVDKVDVLRRNVLTTNGGKYHVTKEGVRTLNGPQFPNYVEEN